MGRRSKSRGRTLNGLLLLDKPLGRTSNSALQAVKALLNAAKAGHTGTLDPLATGLLPICLGSATRLAPFLLNHNKRYRTTVRLGRCTTTGDHEGETVSERPVPELNRALIESVLAQFRGEISQIPPLYSALKQDGRRLYELAREGIEVERPARTITIHQLTLTGYTDCTLELDVCCSKGTYIRSLAEDIGNALGCGGFVDRLKRTEVGNFMLTESWTLDQLEAMTIDQRDQCLLPVEAMVSDWPAVMLSEAMHYALRHGQSTTLSSESTQGWVRLVSEATGFIGVGEILSDGVLAPRRIIG